MANVVFDTYQRASFRGVPFLFENSSQTGGRKNAVFEYPEQDTRFVQDLGLLQRIYRMTAIITSNDASYISLRNAFIEALEEEGPGVLVHPTDGTKNVFLSGPYVLEESMEHINVARFRVTFYETGAQIYPTTSPSNAASIAQQINNFTTEINEDFTSAWSTLVQYQGSYNYSRSLIQNMINEFKFALSISTTSQSAANQYQADLNILTNNQAQAVFDSALLASYVQNIFFDLGQLNSNSDELFFIIESFFSYDPVTPLVQTTVPLEQQERNRVASNQLINTYALVYGYLFTTQTQFANSQQVQNRNDLLNDQFSIVIINNTYVDILGNQFQILSRETLSNLENLRFNAHDYLRRQLANTRTVVPINVPRESLLSLVFAYYDNVDLYNDIAVLNDVVNPTQIVGDFLILSEEGAVG